MDRQKQINLMMSTGVIAIVRLSRSEDLVKVAESIREGGVSIIEFTMTTPNALETIEKTIATLGDSVLIGAGSILDQETARAAILAGAEFIISPTLNSQVIELAHRYDKVIIPGGFSPTEILTAYEQGADFVKVFPAAIGGPSYIKAVRAPMPQLRLVPVGGVTLENSADFIKAGASMIAVGSNLVNNTLVEQGRFDAITDIARKFRETVEMSRSQE